MKNRKKLLRLMTIVVLLFSLKIAAQITPEFDGVVGSYERTLIGSGFSDVTAALQGLIDDVSSQPSGGTIKLSGDVKLTEVYLKSNVHIDIAKGTVIKGTVNQSKPAIFQIGVDSNENINNVKIFCSDCDHTKPNDDINEKFVFDLTEFGMNGQVRAFMLANTTNFWISDAYIIDALTQFNAITLNPYIIQTSTDNSIHKGLRDYQVVSSPLKGDIRYIHGDNQHVGYGVVQVQCGRDVNFVRLSGVGGVTLRLESGSGIQFVGTDNERALGVVKGIKGSDLSLINGFACVMLSPHGRINEDVYVENVKSTSSAFAVVIHTGFFDSELKDDNGDLVDPVKFKKGRFTGPVLVKNAHAIYGTNAYGRLSQEYNFVENSIQTQYPWANLTIAPESDNVRIIPSASAVGYFSIPDSGATPDIVEGEYLAQIDGPISSSGFLPCISTHYNNILYENDKKNVDCTGLSVEDNITENEAFKLYPNPANNSVTIQLPLNSKIAIYDYLGRLVKSNLKTDSNSTQLDVSKLIDGVYVVQVITEKGIKVSKSLILRNN
ncbi:T9SS type A sorting domain-containing protein [Mariniflexile sp. AS56]|uniref:T9SS type A sorting domain-containing protein n=1 Tax=Mariniflexile sp. AS56 TaxID=3063957 RepID=UPI0026EF600D|nr:T9SS type A sorting domain-containing protein [Mariniflexile sp. AS56]MDO7173152.1 T9SS type A sorting domain-containing protein [Mariniflexile sp. AS56]